MADPIVITFDEAARLVLRAGYLLGVQDGNEGRVTRDEADLVRRAEKILFPQPCEESTGAPVKESAEG